MDRRKVLLVEDSEHKRERVLAFLVETFPGLVVIEAHSFNSACKLLDDSTFNLILMDMSLPTYDRSTQESGGRFRTFGGREIARKVIRRSLDMQMVFLTQYDAFSANIESHTLQSLDSSLARECGARYGGLIYYDSSKSAWKEQLERAIRNAT